MILNNEELQNAIKSAFGDRTDEEALTLAENITDTVKDLQSKASANANMVSKDELDRVNNEWAKKYRDRFFEPTVDVPDKDKEKEKEKEHTKLTFENLFKE